MTMPNVQQGEKLNSDSQRVSDFVFRIPGRWCSECSGHACGGFVSSTAPENCIHKVSTGFPECFERFATISNEVLCIINYFQQDLVSIVKTIAPNCVTISEILHQLRSHREQSSSALL